MSNVNTPWLSLYDNVGLFSLFLIRATFPHISDAVTRYNKTLENKTEDDVELYKQMMVDRQPIAKQMSNE